MWQKPYRVLGQFKKLIALIIYDHSMETLFSYDEANN